LTMNDTLIKAENLSLRGVGSPLRAGGQQYCIGVHVQDLRGTLVDAAKAHFSSCRKHTARLETLCAMLQALCNYVTNKTNGPARHLPAMLRNASFRIPELGSGRVASAQARWVG